MNSIKTAALCLCLILSVSGCSGRKVTIERHTEYVLPPEQYTRDCDWSDDVAKTIGGIIERTLPALILALEECNADKEAMREWRAIHDPARND